MPLYFADAWFFIARSNRFDAAYAAALRLEAFVAGSRVITHEGVLSEVLAYFSGAGAFNRQRAVTTVRRALRDFRVANTARELFHNGLELYAARPDKEYSHVDCISMVLMRAHDIRHVLTNDHHFRQEGFIVLSDAP
jgi:uncharacterized protein